MRTVNIKFSLQYLECDLAAPFAEHSPELVIFLDGHFKRKPARVKLDENDLKKIYNLQVSGSIARRLGNIPLTTSIGIASFAKRKNNFGVTCLMDTGTTHITLGEISKQMKEGSFEKELELILHTTSPIGNNNNGTEQVVKKGKLLFKIQDFNLGGVEFKKNNQTPLSAPFGEAQQSMMQIIQTTMQVRNSLGDTIPGTSQIACPFDMGESGETWQELQLEANALNEDEFSIGNDVAGIPNIPLPAAAYAKFETPETNLKFWENAFQTVMDRDGLSVHQYDDLDFSEKARTMVLVNTYLTQYLDYISDTVDRNNRHFEYQARLKQGFENFGDPLVTWSGDCEDDNTGIMQTFSAFQRFNFQPNTPLHEMQQISSQYITVMTLAAVRGAKVDDDPNAPKGAHMFTCFMPVKKFQSAMSKTKAGRYVSSKLNWESNMEVGGEVANYDFPILIGEGTGMYEPLGFKDNLRPVRGYVYRLPSLGSFKKPITHERQEESTFFLGMLAGFTPYFFDRGNNVGGFWYGTTKNNGVATRGVYYTDLVQENHNFALIPQPPLPKNIMSIINEATLLRVPPNDLKLTGAPTPTQNANLDQIVQQIKNLNRAQGQNSRAVPVYIREHQIDSTLADKIANELGSLDRVWKVDYKMEHVTDEVYGYRMMIHCNI